MSFAIRLATPDDAREIAEIHYAGWVNAYGSVVPPEQMAKKQPEKRVPFWQERIARADEIVLVAHDEAGRMQGFIHGGPVLPHDITGGSLAGFDCEIYVLHCRKETQGKGLGRLLIAEIARAFQARGKTALVLWAYTDNAYRPFYDKLGGQVVAEGLDDGVADVAYGWRALSTLRVSVAPPDPVRGGTMTLLRKLLGILMTVICVVVLGYSGYRTVSGQDPAEERLTAIGGLIAVGAFVVFIVFSKCRRRNGVPPELIDDPQSIIQLKVSRSDSWLMAAIFAFAALGCGIAILGGALDLSGQVLAWLGMIVFGAVPLGLMVKRPVTLRLSPDGLEYTGFQIGQIAWSDIRSATPRSMGRIPSVVLELSNEQVYLARRPKSIVRAFERLLSFPPFAFAPPAMGVSAESIVKAIKIRASKFGRSGAGRETLE